MKTPPTNLFCSTFGHNYFRLNKDNPNTPDLICKCCKNYFQFNEKGHIVQVKQNEIHSFSQFLSS